MGMLAHEFCVTGFQPVPDGRDARDTCFMGKDAHPTIYFDGDPDLESSASFGSVGLNCCG
jgi:hypothetical protein